MKPITRRRMLTLVGTALGSAPCISYVIAAQSVPRKRLGIQMHSYGAHWKAARDKHSAARFSDALEFLNYAHELNAGGVQVAIGQKDLTYAGRIRANCEKFGMYFEAQFALPKSSSDLERFEHDVRLAKEAGATVFRTALLSGRRYETFDSAEAFRRFHEQSWNSLALAEPILKRQRLRVAVENHKDWLIPELLEMLRKLSSESVGVCIDTGNNIALLEDPMEVVEAFAPFAASVHFKDMAVQEYADGFLLSEVSLGDGFLNLPKIVGILQKANPAIQFSLEMITRDPLRIPCLTDKYWVTMQNALASRLARALGSVKQHVPSKPLPRVSDKTFEQQLAFEDANVRQCLARARQFLV